ncbi:MAG: BTAD domain-containing putative transcriptional regulator [Gemmatimonadota bacterium]
MPQLYLQTFGGLAILRMGAPAEGAGAQRRRLALLALLAAAGERGMPREKLLLILWPESDLERARKNLAQAVYALRRDLGAEELVQGTNDLRLSTDLLSSDLAEFQRAIAEGRKEDAVALYKGPFLEGIFFDEAPEFERWAESERAHYAREYAEALESLAIQAANRGEPRIAAGYWRKLANTDPLNAKAALGLMRGLAAAGDRAQALQHYRVYEMLLRQELELAPDAELRRYADDLRQEKTPVPGVPAAVAPAPSAPPPPPAAAATPPASASPPPARPTLLEVPVSTVPGTPAVTRPAPTSEPSGRRMVSGFTDEYARPRPISSPGVAPAAAPIAPAPAALTHPPFLKRASTRWGMAIGVALGAMLAAGIFRMRATVSHADSARKPVVAVGLIQDYTRGTDGLARPLADMLATDLARGRDVEVISTARMYELMSQGRIADTAAAMVRAARAAGATELLDGALYQRSAGRLQLDLRRTSLASGSMIQSYTAEAGDLFALVTEIRKGMASFADTANGGSLADVTTRSIVAYRLYEEGLRARFLGDINSARRLLLAALTEDSTFAMAAYWLARSGGSFNETNTIRDYERALRLASRASDRERLLITAGWANATDDPSRIAIAETLTVRYPTELEGYLWLGIGRVGAGDFLGALAPFRRVIDLDSASLHRNQNAPRGVAGCHACDAFYSLISAYQMMDSLPAAERVAREWLRRQPQSFEAAGQVSWVLMMAGRYQEALAADQQVSALAPELQRDGFKAMVALRAGDYPAADAYYHGLESTQYASDAFEWLNRSLRAQGRPHDAQLPARQLRAAEKSSRRGWPPYNALFEYAAWFDLGEFRRAAALCDSISRSPRDSTPSQIARHRVWTQTLRATALAAAGDTTLLRRMADSIETWGRGSAYGRDQRLHNYVRGLLLEAEGQLEEAASAYQRSVYSPTAGYTRINMALGRVLLRLGRPKEAAFWGEAGLKGGFDAGGSYVTQTELAELAATAWDAAGVHDSALVRYDQVVHNWRNAEPMFSARVERARLRAAALRAGR